jgi:hypothetical protein
MDQRDADDPMLEINGRIKALIVEAMKANKEQTHTTFFPRS